MVRNFGHWGSATTANRRQRTFRHPRLDGGWRGSPPRLAASTVGIPSRFGNKSAARALLVFVTIATAITCLDAVFEFEGLRIATGAVNMAAFGTGGSNAAVLLLAEFLSAAWC